MEPEKLVPELFEYKDELGVYIGKHKGIMMVLKIKGDIEHEAKLIMSLDNPDSRYHSIVKCYGTGILNSFVGVLTEYANGGDLFTFICNLEDNPFRFNPDYLVTIIYQIAVGIGDIHKRGVFHGDIKAENIVLQKDNECVRAIIIDFEHAIEDDQKVLEYGTPQYFPPEMDGKTPLTMAADIYAFGVCILLILMPEIGRIPKFEEIVEIMKIRTPLFEKLEPLKWILERIFVKDPMKRITIEEILSFEFFDSRKPYMYDRYYSAAKNFVNNDPDDSDFDSFLGGK